MSDTSLGYRNIIHSDGIDFLQLSAALKYSLDKFYPFFGNSFIKFDFKIGLGIGFNRPKSYYNEYYFYKTYGQYDAYSFIGYEEYITRKKTDTSYLQV